MRFGWFDPRRRGGRSLMVLAFAVMSSPVVPLPRVTARMKVPFS